jgi:hypothetical protein
MNIKTVEKFKFLIMLLEKVNLIGLYLFDFFYIGPVFADIY